MEGKWDWKVVAGISVYVVLVSEFLREEAADLTDAFVGLDEGIAADAFPGAVWPCEDDAVKKRWLGLWQLLLGLLLVFLGLLRP